MAFKWLTILVLLVALPFLGVAQDQGTSEGGDGGQAAGDSAGDSAGGEGTGSSDTAGESAQGTVTESGQSLVPFGAGLYRASEGLSVAISNEAGDITGQVRDIIINRNGEMRFLVTSITQGAQAGAEADMQPEAEATAQADAEMAADADAANQAGMEGTLHLVPVERVTFDAGEGEFRLDMEAGEVSNLMTLEDGSIPAALGEQDRTSTAPSIATGEEEDVDPSGTAAGGAPGLAGSELIFVSAVLGSELTNLQAEDLGRVEDVVINVPQTRVEYLAVSTTGGLGLGDRYFALPMRTFIDADAAQKVVVFDIRQEDFRGSPGFPPAGAWPGVGDQTFGIVGDDGSDELDTGPNDDDGESGPPVEGGADEGATPDEGASNGGETPAE